MTTNIEDINFLSMFLEIAQKVEKGKKLDHITRDDKITSFGIDSVSMMEIIGFFEDELNIKIPDEKLALIQTVGDIENVIKSQHKSQHRSQQPEQLL